MLANDSHIYCPSCGAIQPLLRDYMPADEQNDHAATDLLCDTCRFIVATVHHLAPEEAKAEDADYWLRHGKT